MAINTYSELLKLKQNTLEWLNETLEKVKDNSGRHWAE